MKILNQIKPAVKNSYYEKDILIKMHFTFTTNNRIFFPNGKHKDLYDHTYQFDISIKSPVDAYGLAIDFYKIEKDYSAHIAPMLNAPILNESLPQMNTTVENIAYYIWQRFEEIIDKGEVYQLTVYETKHHSVTLERWLVEGI